MDAMKQSKSNGLQIQESTPGGPNDLEEQKESSQPPTDTATEGLLDGNGHQAKPPSHHTSIIDSTESQVSIIEFDHEPSEQF